MPEIGVTEGRTLRATRHQDSFRVRCSTASLGEDGAAVRAGSEIVIRDCGVEVVRHLRDRVGRVHGGDDVEHAAQDAGEASKDEGIVVDDQDAPTRLSGGWWNHPHGYVGG